MFLWLSIASLYGCRLQKNIKIFKKFTYVKLSLGPHNYKNRYVKFGCEHFVEIN